MTRHDGKMTRSLLAGLLLLGAVPACSASGFPRLRTTAPDGSGRIAYRPVFPANPDVKPVYLNGYAGTTYPPLGSGARLSPTGYWVTTRDPNGPCRSWWGRWRR